MKFYFHDAGYLDDEGNYHIKNTLLLEDKAISGDENARILLDPYFEKNRSLKDFAVCIAKDYFGVYIDLLNGNLWDAFISEVQSEARDAAAKIVLKALGKSISKLSIISTAGELDVAAYNCRGEW